jgi:hypothetical protein
MSGIGPKKMPDCIRFVLYRTGSGTNIFHSSNGLIGCQTVQHSSILNNQTELKEFRKKILIDNFKPSRAIKIGLESG